MSNAADHIRRASALTAIADERRRQIEVEGWDEAHDDAHADGALAKAAGSYAIFTASPHYGGPGFAHPVQWPWSPHWFKPTDRRNDLVKAGALIVAEIERLDRAAVAAGLAHPEPPWPPGADNAKRVGWADFFAGKPRETCPFPRGRKDLHTEYREGWDHAQAYKEGKT